MRWRILSKIKSEKPKKREQIVKILSKNRSLSQDKIKDFFDPKDPVKLTLRQVGISPLEMRKAIKRIKQAVKKKEKIIVCGDYDADGVCSTAIVWEALTEVKANALPFIPKREVGYGLKVSQIDQSLKEEVSLIITVDQGIVQSEQIGYARKKGIDVIVTDHHSPGKTKPKAVAIIHTTKLAGAGVAWFFGRELMKVFKLNKKPSLDLVTIGTVADMVSLLGPSRSLVKYGLDQVSKTNRIGLQFLFQAAGLKKENISTYEIGYIIGPRINASGRIEDPMDPLRLLCLKKDLQRARQIALKLNENNKERQQLTESTAVHARQLWLKQDGKSSLIFVYDQSYREGIIGLVAQKLTEEFYRPSIVLSWGEKESRASARSIQEFNIIEAIRTCADLLDSHGGHPLAAGFTVKTGKIDLLKTKLLQIASEKLGKEKLERTLVVDVELVFPDLTISLFNELKKFEPFGQDNPTPVFVSRKINIVDARLVGAGQRHLRLYLKDPQTGIRIGAIGFGLGDFYSKLSPDKPIDIAYNLSLNEWNGEKRLQLKIRDIKI